MEKKGNHIYIELNPIEHPDKIYFDEIWQVRKELLTELYQDVVNSYNLDEKTRNKVRYRVLINEKPLSIVVDFLMPFKVGG